MQPIVWIVIVGVAAVAMGTGFLSTDFSLNVQNLGVAETDLVSPINTANIDFTISKIKGPNAAGQIVFKNKITKCSFHTPTTLGIGTTIICKLTDDDDDVIAEGKVVLTQIYIGSTPDFNILITQVAFLNANDVQKVHDVKIVVLAPKPGVFAP